MAKNATEVVKIMPITILDGATISATGGTAKTFSQDGRTIPNGRYFGDGSEFDIRKRDTLLLTNLPEKAVNGGTQYSKGRRTSKAVVHDVDADSGLPYEAVNISVLVTKDVRCSSTMLALAVNRVTQLLFDSELSTFNTTGALPD